MPMTLLPVLLIAALTSDLETGLFPGLAFGLGSVLSSSGFGAGLSSSPAMASVSCLTAASASAWVAFSSFSTLEAASTASANFLALASV